MIDEVRDGLQFELEEAQARIAELESQLKASQSQHYTQFEQRQFMANLVENMPMNTLQEENERLRQKTATLESQLSIYRDNRAAVQAAIEKAEGEKREAEQKLADERQKGERDYETLRDRFDLNIAELNEARAQLDEWKEKAENRDAELVMSIEEKLAAEAEAAKLKAELGEVGEEGRRMTDEIERLSTAVEWVLQEVQETICAQRGYSGATVEEYFQANERVKLPLRAQDVKMLQSAINPAATVAEVKG